MPFWRVRATLGELASERLRLEKSRRVCAYGSSARSEEEVKVTKPGRRNADHSRGKRNCGYDGKGTEAAPRTRTRNKDRIALRRSDGRQSSRAPGNGRGMGFEDTIKADVEAGELKILRVCGLQLEASTFIVYSKQRPLSPLAQEFLGLLREARDREYQS